MTIQGYRRRIALAILVSLFAAGAGYLRYLGWLGGPVLRLVPAAAAPPPGQRHVAAMFLSGDAGFNTGMAPRIMQRIAARGIPVLGMNTLTAFARRRTPDEARALVVDAVRRALRLPGTEKLVLIGQSFGADMLQYAVADLPRDLRPRIALVVLAVPGDTLLFKATPGGWLDGSPDLPALPTARRIDWVPLLCIHGAIEANSLCPSLHGPNLRVETLPGDHYLHHDAAALADTIWRAVVEMPHG